jgi:hypothetical protein
VSQYDYIFWISLGALVVLCLAALRRSHKRIRLILLLCILAGCGIVYFRLFQSRALLETKGERPHELAFIIILYLFMVVGMICQYLYSLLIQPRKQRPPFDWGNFLAPLFASPIVSIPMLVAFQNSEIDLTQLTLPRVMVFVVAFQNGFFWKEIFESRRRSLENDKNQMAQHV